MDTKEKGSIPLAGAWVLVNHPGAKHEHYFEILTRADDGNPARLFPLKCMSAEELAEWVATLEHFGVLRKGAPGHRRRGGVVATVQRVSALRRS